MTQHISKNQPLTDTRSPKRAVIFARTRSVPYDPELDQAQLKAQIQACRDIAAGIGAGVVSEYRVVDGTTGAKARQATEELLKIVEAGGIDYVIAISLDRLARRPKDLAHIAERLATSGARLATTTDPHEAFQQDIQLFCLVAKERERRAA